MSYTKKQALTDSIALWHVLATNKDVYKEAMELSFCWTIIAKEKAWKIAFPKRKIKTSPCCSYFSEHNIRLCEGFKCLIKWPSGKCNRGNSPAGRWVSAKTIEERMEFAGEVEMLAKDALNKLGVDTIPF